MENYSEERVLSLACEAYQAGKASFTVDLSRATLLVIDMQREVVQPYHTKFWGPDATRRSACDPYRFWSDTPWPGSACRGFR